MKLPLLTAMAAAIITSGSAAAGDRAHPTVVELYQSQGCSSCPPANANLNAIADRPDLLPLSFSVTYWDYLGWKDTFAKKAYTVRQWDYARDAGRPNVATPQMVVNGTGAIIGHRKSDVENAIRKFDRGQSGPDIAWKANTVSVGSGKGDGVVWIVRYDPRELDVPIQRGENTGKTLPHRNIVKQLVKLGGWSGKASSYKVPPATQGHLKTALLVQSEIGGPIVAASRKN